MAKEENKEGLKMAALRTLGSFMSRLGLANLAGLRFGGLRDYYKIYGWIRILTPNDFMAKYIRQDICSRIIDAPPAATWSNAPLITLDNIDEAQPNPIKEFEVLAKRTKIWSAILRADKLCRLGSFSMLFFGFDDTGTVSKKVIPGKVKNLLYLRPISRRQVNTIDFETDPLSERFGKPVMYEIDFESPEKRTLSAIGGIEAKATQPLKIHWTRVIHIVESPLEDDHVGTPIIERIFNQLDDLLKVSGGTAENFWLSANRGMQADIDKDMDLDPDDAKALGDEMEEYTNQLSRVIKTRGVKLNVLKGEHIDPSKAFDMIMAIISGTTGIPRRILLGSEAGQLASEQDRANWAERIDERRQLFAEPTVLRPILDVLQEVGLLPEGDINIIWPSAFIMSPLELSMEMAQRARAVGNLSRQTGNKTTMQLTTREEARKMIGLSGDLKDSDMEEFIDPTLEAQAKAIEERAGAKAEGDDKGGNVTEDDDKASQEKTE